MGERDASSGRISRCGMRWLRDTILPGIEPGNIVFPSQNNNIVSCFFSVLQSMWGFEIFSRAPGQL
jgi:hypothetical protein